jgi:hypothetical protein
MSSDNRKIEAIDKKVTENVKPVEQKEGEKPIRVLESNKADAAKAVGISDNLDKNDDVKKTQNLFNQTVKENMPDATGKRVFGAVADRLRQASDAHFANVTKQKKTEDEEKGDVKTETEKTSK